MKRMMKKLTANILAFVLLISGCVFEPGAGLVKAEGAEGGELLYVEYRGAHANLQSAAEEALAVTAPEDYKGIVVSRDKDSTEEKILTGEDFAYLNTAWKHASVIDLGGISVKDNAMGSDYMYEDEDGNTVEGTEQIIGSLSVMSSSSKAVQVETLILPADLKTLGMGALAALPNLKVVEIPDSVTDIGWAALYDMPALEKVSYHGTGLTSLNGNMFYNYRNTSPVTLNFSNASGLQTVNMAGSGADVKGFDFTGCTNLNSVDLSGQLIDFSAGREKEWLDAFGGEVTYNDQKPMLAISAAPVDPLELSGEFSGPPALKGLLLDGTDVLSADAVIPDWIDSSYIADFSDNSCVSVKYLDPSGVEEDTLNTSVGGIHTIQWSFKWIHPQLNYTTFELPVEVIIPEEQKMEDVYLRPGATGGNGTEAKPAPTLSMALSYLKRGGTLHLLGDAALPEGILLPENLTIMGTEGADKPVLTLEGNLSLSSDLTIDGVKLEAAKKLSLYANGHTLTVGEHMSNEPTAEEINIYGGGTSALSGDTHLVLKGGNFANVSGGCYLGGGRYDEVASDGRLSGDTHIEIGGSADIKNVYGGGYLGGAPGLGEAHVDVGDTCIEMSGGTVGVLYGGGYTQTEGSADAGSTHVTVTGGTVHGIYGGGYASAPFVSCTATTENVEILLSGTAVVNSPENLEAEAVYGGGYAGSGISAFNANDVDDCDCADVTGDVKLTIQDDASMRAVYGGGYVFSDRDSSARVEGNVDISYEGGSAARIYGGGNYSEYDYDEPMDNAGVGGAVNIYAKGGDLTGTDLWGKGTDGDPVAEGASIYIQGYGTDIDNPQEVSTLFHFDTLILENSHVLFPAGISPNLYCDDGDGRNIEMKNSSVTFGHSVAETFAVNDLTTDGNAAITLHLSDRNDDSAIPLTVNGTITVSQPIALELVGTGSAQPEPGNKVFVTDYPEGNDSLVSDKFSLQNEEFRLIKKDGALQLTPYDSLEMDEQDPPRNLTGIAPSRYGGEDGIIQGMMEGMEYALSPDGPFTPWQNDSAFAAGTYYVRYAPVEDKKLPSDAVEVTVPDGEHIISYHVKNGQLGEDAPLKVAHGASFEFQWKAEEGYMLDWLQCFATGGVMSHEGDNFKVENVTEDVTVTIVATEIPGMVKIIKQPHDVTVRAGHAAVFELTAEGEEEVRYQWYADKGRGFSAIAGETGPVLTTGETAESEDGYLYYCQVSNIYGSVKSETVTLRVIEAGETVEANEQDNAILGITAETEATIGDVLPFTAFGGEMDNARPAQGDTRFVPLSWSTAMDNGSWTDAPYSAEIRTDWYAQGEQTLTVIFAKQRYNGAEWEDLGIEDEKTVTFRLEEKEDSGNKGDGGNSGNEGGGSGDSGNEGGDGGDSGNEGGDGGDSGNEGGGSGDSGNQGSETGHPQTGDTAPVEIYATLAMVAGCSYLGLLFKNRKRGMTEQEKKELTASIIAWARKGGRLRKAAAVALLFIIILYYHSIGKRLSVDWRAAYRG